MLQKMILIGFLSISSATVFHGYLSKIVPVNSSYIILGLFILFTIMMIKVGISFVFKKIVIALMVQAGIMGLISYTGIKIDYTISKYTSLFFGLGVSLLGWSRIKSIIESLMLNPLGFLKKTYDTQFFNLNKDNANINLNIESIDKLGDNGREFEKFIAKLYRAMGFTSKTTMDLKEENDLPECIMNRSGNGEQGADVIVFFNKPEIFFGREYDGFIIQCKQYSNKVENKAIQEVVGAVKMYEKHFIRKLQPVVITNNYFTGPAEDLAKANEVILINRDSLPELVKEAMSCMKNIKETLVA